MNKSKFMVMLLGVFLFVAAVPLRPSQLIKTSLRVIVQDESGAIVEGATVAIFKTEDDYRQEINPVAASQKTDKKGRVTFKKIPAESYYVMATLGEKKNDGMDVKTAKLEESRMNSVNVVIR